MKNNLVKILATLGLIVAIALILKGVFGIGKIGFKSFSSNNNIIFEKCYDTDEFSNYKKSISASIYENRDFEIDLSKDIVTRTVVWKDETIKRNKEKNNFIMPKVELDTFRIVSKTKDFVKTDSLGGIMGKNSFYTFFLNSKKMQLFHSLPSGEKFVVNFNCKSWVVGSIIKNTAEAIESSFGIPIELAMFIAIAIFCYVFYALTK